MKQETSEWHWHQLGYMQVCTSLQSDNHTSTPSLSFYRPDVLPAAQPTASKHWRQGIFNNHFTANSLKSLPMEKIWKSVKIWENHGHEFGGVVFGLPCILQLLTQLCSQVLLSIAFIFRYILCWTVQSSASSLYDSLIPSNFSNCMITDT